MWIRDYKSLIDFFSIVIVCAPNRFFREEYLNDDEQLNLDVAFDVLRQGMHYATDRIADGIVANQIGEGLKTAYDVYKAGNAREGSRVLQEVEKLVISSVRRPRRS